MRTNDDGRVTELILRDNGLAGALPADLGTLSNLKILVLADNHLSGKIPPELGDLSNLAILSLAMNRLSGEIPVELADLSNLVNLRLNGNRLTGVIPAELGRLSRLTGFDVVDNQLGGEIPPELAGLKQLGRLFLSRNPGLTGCMPDELLEIENNDVEGLDLQPCGVLERRVLSDLFEAMNGNGWIKNDGWLSDSPLEQWHGVSTDRHDRVISLDLTKNDVSGGIPRDLSRLTLLQQLRLGGNQIGGCLPPALLEVPDNDFHVLDLPDCPPPVTMDDVSALSWFADGLNEDEKWAVNSLRRFVGSADDPGQRLADQVVNAGWFTDGMVWEEAWTIGVLADITANYRHLLPAVVEFEWAFDDNLPWREWNTITRVRDLEAFSPGSGVRLTEFSWLYDDITDVEDQAIAVVRHLAEFSPGLEARIIGLPWFADGITPDDTRATRALGNVFSAARTLERDPFELLVLLAEEADGPYRPLETMAMLSIGQAPFEEEEERKRLLEELTSADWFADGLTDMERVHIIAHGTIYSEYRNLPNFNTGIIDSKVVELPLAGEVKLWVVGSSTVLWEDVFELLEEAATGSEWLFADPFPYSEVVVSIVGRFDYDVNTRFFGGLSIDYGRHIALIDGLSKETLRGIVHHEVAHSYFNGLMGHSWFIEAGAEYAREFTFDLKGYSAVYDRDRLRLLVRNHCTSRGVQNVVEALVDDPAVPRWCRNMIGMQLLLDLEEVVGIKAMQAALGELHHRAKSRNITNTDREIYEAFVRHAPPGTQDEVQELWDNFYGPFSEEEG